eukprot:SAG31_NODE_2902_length_4931_cov_3.338369_1_plen_65_part_00
MHEADVATCSERTAAGRRARGRQLGTRGLHASVRGTAGGAHLITKFRSMRARRSAAAVLEYTVS